MAHKTMINGTAYNLTGGKTILNGSSYNIIEGKTFMNGTKYNLIFKGKPTAMLYSDGDFVFQYGNKVETGKTLIANYTGFEDKAYSSASNVPWNSNMINIKNVYFKNEISPISLDQWFYKAQNMTSFNTTNLNIENVTSMINTYYFCGNLTGSPICGNNVINMWSTYCNCYKLTGSPVCGDKVTMMYQTYYNCTNLTGAPVCGVNVTNMQGAYYNCKKLNAGTFYFYSKVVSDARSCFQNKNNFRRYNIHVPANSTTLNTFIINNTNSIVGKAITWTKMSTYYYNRTYNIYIYPNTSMA